MNNADRVLASQDTLAERIATLAGVLCPFLGLIAAIVSLWGWAFTWVELALLLVMYLATGLGITVGFHRLFAHRSFDTVRPVRFLLAVLGSMSESVVSSPPASSSVNVWPTIGVTSSTAAASPMRSSPSRAEHTGPTKVTMARLETQFRVFHPCFPPLLTP